MQARKLIAIGASAGGLEALQGLLSNLSGDASEVALVIAQHVSPTYKSQLVELLSRQTELPISDAEDGQQPQGGNVYITPPDRDIAVSGSRFLLTKPGGGHGPRPSVDRFLTSLAQEFGDQAVAVILSGTGSDGSLGLLDIREQGGLVIVQQPESAKYDGMPRSAIETRQVHLVAEPEEIGANLLAWCRQDPERLRRESRAQDPHPEYQDGDALSRIMQLLSDRTGTDFSRYKPATIGRRLEKRLISLGIDSIDAYLELLQSKPDEADKLFTTILIGVTYYFRDYESYQTLREHLQQLLQHKTAGDRVRIWVPGCATGEEAYSIAILVADILQERLRGIDVQLFATDLDNRALETARKGVYPGKSLENLPEGLRDTYFTSRGDNWEIAASIRSMVLFSRHDVTSNPPFLKLDLISCRNLLIYFGQELQQHVLPLFHYALRPQGLLFLGKSETIGSFSDLFETISSTHKVFLRKGGTNPYSSRLLSFRSQIPSRSTVVRNREQRDYTVADMVRDTLYHSFEHPYVVVNNTMDVIEVSGDMRGFLSIRSGAMNASLMALIEDRYEIELRSLLTEAIRSNTAVTGTYHRIENEPNVLLRFRIKPVLYSGSHDSLYLVVFERTELDATVSLPASEHSDDEHPRVQELEVELAATREHLQNYIEELETSTEELQSLNEELQSTNEELQSSNEELETSNEELQSTNEELQIAYSELKSVSDEAAQHRLRLEESEANLQSVFSNTLQGFLLIDRSYRVVVYNQRAASILEGMSAREIATGSVVIDFFPGEAIESLHAAFTRCLEGEAVSEVRRVRYHDESEHWHHLQYTPVFGHDGAVSGVSFAIMDITETKQTELELADQTRLNQLILDSADVGICLTDEQGLFVQVNTGYCRLYGYEPHELVGKPFTMVLPEGIRDYAERLHRRFLDKETEESAGEWDVVRRDGSMRTVSVGAGRLERKDGSRNKVTTVVDITAQKLAEKERNRLFTVSVDLMCILRFDGFFQQVNPAWVRSLGHPEEYLLSRPFIELVHQDDRRGTLDFFQQMIENPEAVSSFENRCVAADGSLRWLSWNVVVIPEQRLMYAVARDVTDARRAEKLLRDTQSVARVGGWELDLATGVTNWTDEVYRIYDLPVGRPTDYMSGLEAYHPEDQELVRESIRKASEYGESSDIEVRFTSSAGRRMWVRITFKGVNSGVDSRGATEKVIGTIQDITLQKQAELENRRLSQVASRTDNGVVIADESFRIEWVNHGFEEMTGVDLARVQQRPLDQVFLDLHAASETTEALRSGLRGKESMQEELHIVRRDSRERWVRLDITPVRNQDDRAVNWIALMHDITEQREFQDELIAAKERAEEMNRLKSAFLANMSHEIRTPLNGVLGMAHVIQRDTTQDSVREYAELLEQSGTRLLRTINQVLDLSTLEARQIQPVLEAVEVNQLAQRICDSMQPAAEEKGLNLAFDPHSEALSARADSYLVENILLNLLNNAIKFTPRGTVSVTTRKRVSGGSTFVAIEVQDTGIGMSKGYMQRVFAPFSQESSGQDRRYEGTGLGLSISREYALLMDGDIEVSSQKRKGSTFRLLLPQAGQTEKMERK